MRFLLAVLLLLLPMTDPMAADSAKSDTETDTTGWLLPEKGAEEQKMGAKVESVTESDQPGVYRIEVSVPKLHKEIEEVIAVGHREKVEKIKPIIQIRRFELINNPDTGRSGVVIYVGKTETFALKFNYYEGGKFPDYP